MTVTTEKNNTGIITPLLLPTEEQRRQKPYLTMYHGKATDILARMNSRNARPGNTPTNAVIEAGNIKAVINKFYTLSGKLGVNTHKLLSVGIAGFTELNNYDRNGGGQLQYSVEFPLKEYARSLGYTVDEAMNDSPEEKKKAKNALDNARKAIRKDLELLQATTLTWEEKVKGETEGYDRISLVSRTSIKNGIITIEFGVSMANYLARLPLTQYPTPLLSIDARNPNAYNIGLRIWEHFNNDNNQRKGTADRLKVSTLLSYTNLPAFDKVSKNRKNWEERIKEPFETALDNLTTQGVIENWKYTHAKGVDLTNEEARNITDYKGFTELYITYTLKDAPDHTERLALRDKEKKRRHGGRQNKVSCRNGHGRRKPK